MEYSLLLGPTSHPSWRNSTKKSPNVEIGTEASEVSMHAPLALHVMARSEEFRMRLVTLCAHKFCQVILKLGCLHRLILSDRKELLLRACRAEHSCLGIDNFSLSPKSAMYNPLKELPDISGQASFSSHFHMELSILDKEQAIKPLMLSDDSESIYDTPKPCKHWRSSCSGSNTLNRSGPKVKSLNCVARMAFMFSGSLVKWSQVPRFDCLHVDGQPISL